MKTTLRKYALPFALAILAATGCGDDKGPAGISSDRVIDPLPLALGNSWEYSVEQHAYIDVELEDGSTIPLHFTSNGSQTVDVTRTEAISGDEAYGLRYIHIMDYIFSTGADTTVEVHYLAPRGDKLLLKAIESGYNTGGFIPLSVNGAPQGKRLLAKVSSGGVTRYVPLERLGMALLDAEPTEGLLLSGVTALASDGVQNREDVYFYSYDYVMLYNELYKGRRWISSAAASVGGMEISRKVTNILDELSGYEGPIAEVEETNSIIESISTLTYKLRFYYKGGVGIVQAEIYDSDFDFYTYDEDGNTYKIGTGAWQVVKKLTSHTLK